MERETRYEFPLFGYNFGDAAARGSIKAAGPQGWHVRVTAPEVTIAPGDRTELPKLVVNAHQAEPGTLATITINGDFGDAGKPVLSLRLCAETAVVHESRHPPLKTASVVPPAKPIYSLDVVLLYAL